MILDSIYRFFNDDAKKRYKINKEKQIIERNKELQFINKLLEYKLTFGEYISIKAYVNDQYECNNTELDKALEYSISRKINIHDKKKWALFPVIIKYKLYNN